MILLAPAVRGPYLFFSKATSTAEGEADSVPAQSINLTKFYQGEWPPPLEKPSPISPSITGGASALINIESSDSDSDVDPRPARKKRKLL
ncbi:uncharacterized protein J7T54_004442 [Emericellopsis cladophorae]|uniref:Uncharacterized protein n=1 Tax=Emericellopsis cladophorae TaxID=2686198 RepID=A0A9P9Y4W9_9HYPO|nr:uncharacterized protein J7T54_004442 [Emericellopsis cladophorae]KAI6783415.1 hypothetical protein J7T54_004442 [Emericellopsis cladophorae]